MLAGCTAELHQMLSHDQGWEKGSQQPVLPLDGALFYQVAREGSRLYLDIKNKKGGENFIEGKGRSAPAPGLSFYLDARREEYKESLLIQTHDTG